MNSNSTPLHEYLEQLPLFNTQPIPPRLISLYSDFNHQATSNPTGYTANISWWDKTLIDLVQRGLLGNQGNRLSLRVDDELLDQMKWGKLNRPGAIGAVISELVQSHSLLPKSAFLSSDISIYYTPSVLSPTRLASALVGRPLWWGFQQLSLISDPKTEAEKSKWKRVKGQDYVVKSLVEKSSKSVYTHLKSLITASISSRLYTVSTITKAILTLPDANFSSSDISTLLKFMERDQKCIVKEGNFIKVLDDGENLKSEMSAISEVDKGVLEMTTTVGKLQDQIGELEEKITERQQKAASSMKANHSKQITLSYLRSKKQLQELLSKRVNSLETIQSVLLKIESAAGDVEVLKTYETSTATLRLLLSSPSLQMEKVQGTMDVMADVLADHSEIEAVIQTGGAVSTVSIDESELEKELQMLVGEKEKEEKGRKESEEKDKQKEIDEDIKNRLKALRVVETAPVGSADESQTEKETEVHREKVVA